MKGVIDDSDINYHNDSYKEYIIIGLQKFEMYNVVLKLLQMKSQLF